ncbi:2-(5'-triphosphoribosyl)-3'-dephospho CoA synthase [Geobacter sp. FeAm09]|uniref:triphosphoribosyl-dephospho-CoA synthase n=1 Tax=Geobacter sp. FeAm09 TaxID=2597769 RepID=UPI0011ECDE1D|nr:triphosphoribosyl-dephospho-CoA synthase [Geobacter sp. FeAm09]QEM66999.1 2-(5'-triphosphoribosyl)-3'-dephospho CoA synthase [Geobacter sp. FeAm09]
MNSSRTSDIELLAMFLVKGVAMELYLTPKPGLVDLNDCGSHHDLSLAIMERSIRIVADYLDQLCRSLAAGEEFARQAAIGRRAEQTMLASLGTNTHKGYLFLSGLLLVAAWHAPAADERSFRDRVAALAGDFFAAQGEQATHGQQQRALHGAGGIVREAMNGLPALFDEAVPAYLAALEIHEHPKMASFAMLARLMQTVDDTTTLHRCGSMGLSRIRRDGRQLERLIAMGEECEPFLQSLNREYIRMNLTMGGVADMLGLSYGYLLACGCLLGFPERNTPLERKSGRRNPSEGFSGAA